MRRVLPLTLALAATSAIGLAMLVARAYRTGELSHRSLLWNLFLAWLPYVLATVVAALAPVRRTAAAVTAVVAGLAWLVFLPNAPYLLTDLIHIRPREAPLWYDALVYGVFGCTGVLLGLASLLLVHRAVEARVGWAAGWTAVLVAIPMASFGIYLGRFQRWNSWNVLSSPRALARDLRSQLGDPVAHPRIFVMTAVFSMFLLAAYAVLLTVARLGAPVGARPADAPGVPGRRH